MAARSLVLFRIGALPDEDLVESKKHRAWEDKRAPHVYTRLTLTQDKIARGYLHGRIEHRNGEAIEAIVDGRLIHQIVRLSTADAYYNRAKKLIIVESNAPVAHDAVRRLNQDCAELRLSPVHVDFVRFLDGNATTEVFGAWSRMAGKIRSRAAFAEKDMRSDDVFQSMSEKGELSTLSVRLDFSGQPLRVSVSRWASTVFYGPAPLERRIEFLEHLAKYAAPPGPRSRARKNAEVA